MTTKEKLKHLNIPGFEANIDNIDLHQIELFVRAKINDLFSKFTSTNIQNCVRLDDNIKIVTYLTYIVEVGSTKSVAVNNLHNKPSNQMGQYVEIIAWAHNIALANELRAHQMADIPCMGGDFYIYFSKNTLMILVDRTLQHIAIGIGHSVGNLDIYADLMIQGDMAL